MSKRTKFILNRSAFRQQVLRGKGTRKLLLKRLGKDAVDETDESPNRARVRLYDDLSSEAQNGTLSRRFGGE